MSLGITHIKWFLHRRPRNSTGAMVIKTGGTAVEKKFGVGITAIGEVMIAVASSNPTRVGIGTLNFQTGDVLAANTAPAATSIGLFGLSVSSAGALHVNTSGTGGFASGGRVNTGTIGT